VGTRLPLRDIPVLFQIAAYCVASQNMNFLVRDQAVAAFTPDLKRAQSATLQKKEECLITISTNHALGVKGL